MGVAGQRVRAQVAEDVDGARAGEVLKSRPGRSTAPRACSRRCSTGRSCSGRRRARLRRSARRSWIFDERGQGLAHRVVSDVNLYLISVQLSYGADTPDAPRNTVHSGWSIPRFREQQGYERLAILSLYGRRSALPSSEVLGMRAPSNERGCEDVTVRSRDTSFAHTSSSVMRCIALTVCSVC